MSGKTITETSDPARRAGLRSVLTAPPRATGNPVALIIAIDIAGKDNPQETKIPSGIPEGDFLSSKDKPILTGPKQADWQRNQIIYYIKKNAGHPLT
tara:strand:- start:738 stop:1028 length:291 start_codon:yes stop_codon:yes gene_type:complete